MEAWKECLAILYHGIDKNKKFGKYSWKAFCEKLQEGKLFMTFCTIKVPKEVMTIFEENLKIVMEGASSSQQNTETTTTLSTIVPTLAPPADVQQLKSSEQMEDALEKVFGAGNSRQTTGRISQHTYSQRDGTLYTLKSPGETGYMVCKLETYFTKDVANLDKKKWWMKAETRSQFLINSIVYY